MKNPDPSTRSARYAGTGQRLAALIVLGVFAGLVWIAWSGRFDQEVRAVATWMQATYDALFH